MIWVLFFLLTPTLAQATNGVVGEFGNPVGAPGLTGGEFSTSNSPAGIAVNDTSGEIYVVDRPHNRIERFDEEGNFISTWGADVISGAVTGTGTINETTTVSAVVANTGKFIVGQIVTGTGIQPGTKITAAPNPDANTGAATLTLSKPATESAAGVALTVVAQPSNVPVNERQLLTVTATAGNYKLRVTQTQGFPRVDTANIPFNAPAAEVKALLGAVPQIGAGNVEVTIAPGGDPGGGAVPGGPYEIEFRGAKADTDFNFAGQPQPGVPPLSGGTATTRTLGEGGSAFETCTISTECKPGVGGSSETSNPHAPGGMLKDPQGIAIDQASGDLYATNQAFRRVEQFTASGEFIRSWGMNVVASGPGQSDELQRLGVDATSGQFRLGFYATQGRGTLISGQPTVTGVITKSGAFAAGQQIKGANIPPGTTILAVVGNTLTLSANATGSGTVDLLGPVSVTGDLVFNATVAEVQGALEALPSLGVGNVVVSGGPGGPGGTASPYLIEFGGSLADTNLAALEVIAGTTPLAGGAGATVATVTEGTEGFEVCETAALCQMGPNSGTESAGGFSGTVGYPAVAPVGAPNTGNVVVAAFQGRVMEFSPTGAFIRAFGWDVVSSGPGNTGTEFEICRQSAGDVCKAGATGAGVGQFGGSSPTRVAADTTGAIYTVESTSNFRVQKFTPAGEGLTPAPFCPSIGGAETLCGTSTANTPIDIAVDPSDNHVYVTKRFPVGTGTPPAAVAEVRVLEFEGETLVDTHAATAQIAWDKVNGLANKTGGEFQYLTATTPVPRVIILGPPVPPTPVCTEATAITADGATFKGTVNPNGGAPLTTTARFEYSADGGTTWTKATPGDTNVGSGEAPVAIEDTVTGLEPNKEYKLRVVATKGGSPVLDECAPFTTDPAPPVAETFAAFYDASSEELVLRGGVNPKNSATSYRFEYGTDPCSSSSCTSTPTASAGAGGTLKAVEERIPGLQPETTYHFLIVADNGVGGEVEGDERTLTTPGDEPCSNEQFRTGASAGLAECRAFEWVSDGDSWGVGITSAEAIGDSGDLAQFTAQAFGQPDSAPSPFTPYTSVRGMDGWEVRAMVPEPETAFGSKFGTTLMSAADLEATLWPEATLGQRQKLEVQWRVSRLDGTRSPSGPKLIPIEHGGAENLDRSLEYPLVGATPDLSTFVFRQTHENIDGTGFKLLADEPLLTRPSRSNLYMISGSELSIINRADGKAGAVIGGVCGGGFGGNLNPGTARKASRALSVDGTSVYFSIRPGAPVGGNCGSSPGDEFAIAGPLRLYNRINGETTIQVSAAQCSPACAGPSGDDTYQGASADGEVAFFTTSRRLLNLDTDNTSDLYVYDADPPSGEPTLALASAGEAVPVDHPTIGSGAEVQGVVDNAADGSRVYFVAKGRLTAAATKGANNLYVYQRDDAHPSGRIGFVGALADGDSKEWTETTELSSYALPGRGGDGHLLLFISGAKLLKEDGDSSRDLYRYHDEGGELECLTCIGDGAFDISINLRNAQRTIAAAEQKARPATANVSAVTFTTSEPLVDEDLNGAPDVYLWREGVLSLVSKGSGEFGARSEGIAPDGEDVFFTTRTAMVGADINNGLDLYDARIGGGFPEASPTLRCASGEECWENPNPAPPAKSVASASFNGSGNPPEKAHCKKPKVRRNGKCVKPKPHKPKNHGKQGKNKKKKGSKHRASANRGAQR